MADEDDIPEAPPKSMPGWVMTFADLMSLLMCFFVLLLSFSEMDLQKFKQVAGSMEKAFGVQREFKSTGIPRGTSIIAQEFSPGRPEPTPLNEIRQFTTDDIQELLKIEQKKVESADGRSAFDEIEQQLKEDIESGLLEMTMKEDRVVIRINEKGSFRSGSATLRAEFIPVLNKIGKILVVTPGIITVSGNTDNVPIQTDLFRSNWELSAIRAFAVIDQFLKNDELDPKRFTLEGRADNNPIEPNDTSARRARNRRVEIVITQEEIETSDEIIQVDDDADTANIPGIEKVETQGYKATLPPSTVITTDGTEDYSEEGDLGVFKEDALYDYETKTTVDVPVPGNLDSFDPDGTIQETGGGFAEEIDDSPKDDKNVTKVKSNLLEEELDERGFSDEE